MTQAITPISAAYNVSTAFLGTILTIMDILEDMENASTWSGAAAATNDPAALALIIKYDVQGLDPDLTQAELESARDTVKGAIAQLTDPTLDVGLSEQTRDDLTDALHDLKADIDAQP